MTTIQDVIATFPDSSSIPTESSAVALVIELTLDQLSYTVIHITAGDYHPNGQRLIVKEWSREIARYLTTSEPLAWRMLLELGVYWSDLYTELTLEALSQRLELVVNQFTRLLTNQYSTIVHILLVGNVIGNSLLSHLLQGQLGRICAEISFRPDWNLPPVGRAETVSLQTVPITDYYNLVVVGIENNRLVWQRHLLFSPTSPLFQSGNLHLTAEVSTCYFVVERLTHLMFADDSPPIQEAVHQIWRVEPARRRLIQYNAEFTEGGILKVNFYDARTGENEPVRAREITHQPTEALEYLLPALQVGLRPLRTVFLVEATSRSLLRTIIDVIRQIMNLCDPDRNITPHQEWLLIFYGEHGIVSSDTKFVGTNQFAEQIDQMEKREVLDQIRQTYRFLPSDKLLSMPHASTYDILPAVQKLDTLSWKDAGVRRAVVTLAYHTPTHSLSGTPYNDLRNRHKVRFGSLWVDIIQGQTALYLQETLGKDYFISTDESEVISSEIINDLARFLSNTDGLDIRVSGLCYPLNQEYAELVP